MDLIEFRSILALVFRLCRLSFYGQLVEHLVLPYCPALHVYCLFTVIVVVFVWQIQKMMI